ncbi:MAG: DUF3048 domain-containing protein [Eubacterium sp.]|nr:DUF3048 domain-containing protein [Eubacterium sp.]MCM1302885.1 DUF3048 domain-containing protein [Butyrivibrio sp.]MCM1343092.1 DUF3048 domain-containing protein [Muribaculaceae bacterium]MCM1410413.1 DUF3048 domain-containing protein [Lachnospiraceae bacterium]
MKRKALAAIILAMSLFAVGCGDDAEENVASAPVELQPQPMATATPEPTAEPESVSPVITDRESRDGMMQSYLTGEWIDEEIGNRRPIAVSIPNQKSCLPHYGITNAGIIYQVPLRDNLTRLFCIFEDFDDLDRIGPVRSIRDYMVYIGLEHDAIICHWGSAYYADDMLNSNEVDNISQATSGIRNPTTVAFDRYDRGGKYNSTDSAYMFIDGLMKGVETRGYNWEYDDTFEPKFLFAADGTRATYDDAKDATKIWPGEKGNYNTVGAYFEYDPATQKYEYSEYGSPLMDEHSGTSLEVDNVVLQVCYGEERDDHGYLIMEMHRDHAHPGNGDGKLLFFTNGKVVEGYWERKEGNDKPAKYYDKDGNELVFNQGKTFICEIWSKWEDYIKYE